MKDERGPTEEDFREAMLTRTGRLTVAESTFSNNSANSNGSNSRGGGIYDEGALKVINSTLSNNSASSTGRSLGGGIATFGTASHMILSVSILAMNKAQQSTDISGSLASSGYNLLQNTTGVHGLDPITDRQVALSDLKLDPTLSKHGGPTQTIALLPGSLAIDAAPGKMCSNVTDVVGNPMTITTYQRGNPRPDGLENACDIGAYESSY